MIVALCTWPLLLAQRSSRFPATPPVVTRFTTILPFDFARGQETMLFSNLHSLLRQVVMPSSVTKPTVSYAYLRTPCGKQCGPYSRAYSQRRNLKRKGGLSPHSNIMTEII